MANFSPAKSAYSRVFLIEGRARVDHKPAYKSCMKAGSPDQAFGDVERIECPDPVRYGQFEEMGIIQGAVGRGTIDLISRYALDLESDLLRLAKKRCPADIQIHLGECTDPSVFNKFTKAFVAINAYLTNWGSDELGALSSDENAAINETSPISAEEFFEILQLSLASRAGDIITNEILDVVICDYPSCGECDYESDGCEHIYAITAAAGGSPTTPADIVFSVNKGIDWYADDIDSLGAAENPSAIGCVGDYIVVVSNDSGSLHYALKAEVDDTDYDELWVENATGFVAGAEPNDCWKGQSLLFICADSGYIYVCEDPTIGVTVLDAGVAVTTNLLAIHALNDEFIVAVGNAGTVVYSENGTTFQATETQPVGVGVALGAVWVKSEDEWLVGDANGVLWYTLDRGETWTQKQDFGARLDDIAFANDSVGYIAASTAAPAGRIWRTYDGGYSWQVIPEAAGQNIPANDRINAVAACAYDVNFVVGVGLADDATDGFIVVGED